LTCCHDEYRWKKRTKIGIEPKEIIGKGFAENIKNCVASLLKLEIPE
jgi:hypothetical protein